MANTTYSNFVLENKIEEMLKTALDMNNYLTVDYSLSEQPGMKKVINKYTATGTVADLTMGRGNDSSIEVSFTPVEYTVGVTQGNFAYYDEQEMTDPMVVETGIKALSAELTNDLTTKAIEEFKKATRRAEPNWTFDGIVDAIAMLPAESEDGLFMLINPAEKAKLRKSLGEDLKYSEGFARTGYIGSVCGVPVITSKAVPAGQAFIASKDAVTCFVKKGVEVEQDRDKNLRKNTIYGRKVMVVALTDDTKVVRMATE